MPKAIFNRKIIAESDTFEQVEGNIYFPPHSLKKEFFIESNHKTTCFWKGTASYYNLEVDGKVGTNAAWVYKDPSEKARNIKDYVAFYGNIVTIERD